LVENIAIPYFHYVSKAYGDWRYSLSITVPAGLSKRWESPIEKLSAQEFTLKTVMLNPSVAYKFNKNFSVAVGANIVYSEGKVYSDGADAGLAMKREMRGDSIDYGYNIAASLHLDNGLNLAATYRSKIKLSEKGKANLYFGAVGEKYDADVSIYIPAALNIAISKDIDKWTLEFVYERTFWSSYKTLNFNYNKPILGVLKPYFDDPIEKKWKDTNTFRLGVTYRYSDKLTLMAGYSYDESPIKEKYISYELPDSNAHIFSAGFKYQQTKNLAWGMAILYDSKKSRTVNTNIHDIKGKFSKGGALLITSGFTYKF
jgi:long-chain fatty acid transport protein